MYLVLKQQRGKGDTSLRPPPYPKRQYLWNPIYVLHTKSNTKPKTKFHQSKQKQTTYGFSLRLPDHRPFSQLGVCAFPAGIHNADDRRHHLHNFTSVGTHVCLRLPATLHHRAEPLRPSFVQWWSQTSSENLDVKKKKLTYILT